MQILLDQLNSRNAKKRQAALQAVRDLSPDQLLELLALEGQQTRRRRGLRVPRSVSLASLMVLLLGFVSLVLFGAHPPDGDISLLSWFLRLTILGFVSLIFGNLLAYGWQENYGRARGELVPLLADADDLCFLLPMLRLQGSDPSPVLSRALQRLLPKLQREDVVLWSREERSALLFPLNYGFRQDPEMTLCCLKTLERVGDSTAIETLWAMDQATSIAGEHKMREAVQECRVILEANAEQEKQAQTLLRASDNASVSAAILLRAATANDRTLPGQLLRPASEEIEAKEIQGRLAE